MSKKKSLLVVGASGFLGSYLLPLLNRQIFAVHTISRHALPRHLASFSDFHFAIDILHPSSLSADPFASFTSITYDVIIVLSSVLHVQPLHSLLRSQSSFYIVVSTTGIYTSLSAPTRMPRLLAESYILDNISQSVILRPNMISGGLCDRNLSRLVSFLRRWRLCFVPVSRGGLIQPIFVKDLARVILFLASSPSVCKQRSYDLGGSRPIYFKDLVHICCRVNGLWCVLIPFPFFLFSFLLYFPFFEKKLGLSREQLLRLYEPKVVDNSDAIADLAFEPSSYYDLVSNIRLESIRARHSIMVSDIRP
jgi:nucleoside-diphosphate-sugar epimerase